MRLVIAGGGTGGHLFPGIAVAEEFLSRGAENQVLFVGTERGIEAKVLPRLGYRLETIEASGIRGKEGLAQLKGIAMLLYGYSQSRRILKEFRPDFVLGVGGYASGPVVMAARGLQISRYIHEQNAIPGTTNKLLSRVAQQVFISLEESRPFMPKEKTLLTGNPLRRQIVAEVASPHERSDDGKFNLLVFGGSSGAHAVNMAMADALPFLSTHRGELVITHQTGENDFAEVEAAYGKSGLSAKVVAFIDNMAQEYHKADLVICRAGATTIAEVTACGKGCIFIPYPHAVDDHQRKNAEALLKEDAGFMLLERELSGERLAGMVAELLHDRQRLAAVADKARTLARLDAAKVIVDEMLKGAGQG